MLIISLPWQQNVYNQTVAFQILFRIFWCLQKQNISEIFSKIVIYETALYYHISSEIYSNTFRGLL